MVILRIFYHTVAFVSLGWIQSWRTNGPLAGNFGGVNRAKTQIAECTCPEDLHRCSGPWSGLYHTRHRESASYVRTLFVLWLSSDEGRGRIFKGGSDPSLLTWSSHHFWPFFASLNLILLPSDFSNTISSERRSTEHFEHRNHRKCRQLRYSPCLVLRGTKVEA